MRVKSILVTLAVIIILILSACKSPSLIPESYDDATTPVVIETPEITDIEMPTVAFLTTQPTTEATTEETTRIMPTTTVSASTIWVPAPDDTYSSNIKYINDEGTPVYESGYGMKFDTAEINGAYPGYSAVIPLMVINGLDHQRNFDFYVYIPGKVRDGFEPIPQEYMGWITVKETEITVLAGNNYTASVMFNMPKYDKCYGAKYEVRVMVRDITSPGFIQYAPAMRIWIIVAK